MLEDTHSPSQQSLFNLDKCTSLSEGFPEKMVLLDCETTGAKPTYHRIIEIGLLVIEHGQIVETWESFILPDQLLPQAIQNLTGINKDMLKNAPSFEEIAEVLLEKLSDRVLVAHNARFDYGFLKNEFSRIGINYSTKPLCSVKFSRALYPQFNRHGLDQIIKRFELSVINRHRAFDDAKLIYDFFLHSSQLFTDQDISSVCDDLRQRSNLPAKLNPTVIKALPKQPGVYYFHDEKGTLLYVGKSVNIRNRVMSHFSQDYKNHKDLKMSSQIADISYQATASDFSAQLLESHEIKQLSPLYNHRLRKVKKLYSLSIDINPSGYAIPVVKQQSVTHDITANFGLFRSYRQIESKLKQLADNHQLCFKLLGLEGKNTTSNSPCFRYQLKKCLGACCEQESAEHYNQRLFSAMQDYQAKVWPWPDAILLREKTADDEQHFHLLKDWMYIKKLSSNDELYDLGYQIVHNNDSVISTPSSNTPQTEMNFDLDTYFILIRFLLNPRLMKLNNLTVYPLSSIDHQAMDEDNY